MVVKGKVKKSRMKGESCGVCGQGQHKVPDSVKESKKVKPKDVFGKNYSPSKAGKVPKGSHRMPDGTIMKDSAMKSKKKTNKTKTTAQNERMPAY